MKNYFCDWYNNKIIYEGNYAILKPIYSFELAKIQPEFYREMLMNIFLFVPLGLSLPYVLSIRQGKYVIIKSIVIGLLLSIIIEYCQYYFCIGTCEVDDAIMNGIGVIIGCTSYLIISMMKEG